MDVIYPVRPGDDNEELRFSLRSLEANLPHGRVWVVGYKPAWLTGVEFIPGNRFTSGHANVYDNIRRACEHPGLTDDVVVMNDDFYVTRPIDELPTCYRSTLVEHINLPRTQAKRGWWFDSLNATLTCLQAHGIADPISYELHVPLVINRKRMAQTLSLMRHVAPDNPPQWRSLYGNLHNIGGQQHADGKTYGPSTELNAPFHSTEDRSFHYSRPYLERMFPHPSRWETKYAASA